LKGIGVKMIRNSIIYRRIWYIKRRNAKRLYIYSRLLSIVIILSVITFYAGNYSIPYVNNSFERQVKAALYNETADAVAVLTKGEWSLGITPDEALGPILSNSDIEKLNELSLNISKRLDDKLKIINTTGVFVPAGALLCDTRLADLGPDVRLKSRLLKGTESEFKFQTSTLQNNKTDCKLNLYVYIKIGVTILFKERVREIKLSIPVFDKIYETN
jgi:hypothetical protein